MALDSTNARLAGSACPLPSRKAPGHYLQYHKGCSVACKSPRWRVQGLSTRETKFSGTLHLVDFVRAFAVVPVAAVLAECYRTVSLPHPGFSYRWGEQFRKT